MEKSENKEFYNFEPSFHFSIGGCADPVLQLLPGPLRWEPRKLSRSIKCRAQEEEP